ncbi:MAG: DUF2442 domain-containing protein [Verrucomicrobiae bacterium]|nr:DUF2442 domain-containing protein [Verrucomicrobiae bacterium]
MSILVDKPKSASYSDGNIVILMESGERISFPVAACPQLWGQPESVLNDIELSPFGLHWPQADEDLSIRGILAGRYGAKS